MIKVKDTDNMNIYDVNYDIAKDNLVTLSGLLGSLIRELRQSNQPDQNEINAFSYFSSQVDDEILSLTPDNEKLINKAFYVYGLMIKQLMAS